MALLRTCITFLMLLVSIEAHTQERIALVIGNADYQISPLNNSINDARDMASTLKELDFKVTLIENANQMIMGESIAEFGERLNKDTVGLFYYSGHAVSYKGANYLVPVGANVNKASHLVYKAINSGLILDELEQSQGELNFVFLDACRNSPFRGFSRGISPGLVKSEAKGVLISYSTAPGEVALDGDGRNSPYTKHLLKEIVKPNITAQNMLTKVTNAVVRETNKEQWPYTTESLLGDFCFKEVNNNCGKVTVNITITSDYLADVSNVEEITLGDGEYYRGQVKDEIRHGKGIYTWLNGDHYEGEWKDGFQHGKGIHTWLNGDRYEGEHKDGFRHGKGFINYADGSRYEGEFKDGNIYGKGVQTLADGSRYEGEFRGGLRHWKGIKNYVDGRRYEGELKDGVPHGIGIGIKLNGERYEGEFKDGLRHGKGIQILANGSRYEGEWKDDLRHGKGIINYADGKRYEGEFKDGNIYGKGIITETKTSYRYEGEHKDGLRHGKGIVILPNGSRYEGGFKYGEAHGIGIGTKLNGERYEGEFKDGEAHGKGVKIWPDGKRYEGEFKNGSQHGHGTIFIKNKLIWKGEWENGEKIINQ